MDHQLDQQQLDATEPQTSKAQEAARIALG